MPGQVDWHLTHFGPQGEYQPELGVAPAEVESVINHRIIGSKHVVAAVSGGVTVEPRVLATKSAVQTDTYGLLKTNRSASQPKQLVRRAWCLHSRPPPWRSPSPPDRPKLKGSRSSHRVPACA